MANSAATPAIYRLHVSLNEIEPLIWRRIELSPRTTLKQLHGIVQVVMGWQDCHLHQFEVGEQRYGVVDPKDPWDADTRPEAKYTLADVLPRKGAKLLYWYDFGDDWFHEIKLEAIVDPAPDTYYPRLMEGARSCPPEDCGGPPGYDDLLNVLASKKHPRHKELRDWLDPDFDPEEFPARTLAHALRRRKTLAPRA